MITQVCNLSCQGCTNFSDLKHTGYVPWSQGREHLESWLHRIELDDFGIMGGEPLINPEWMQWVQGVRDLMPATQIRFTTNGLLLHKYPDILDFFEHIGNTVFKISVHVQNTELEQIIVDLQQQRPWQQVQEYGILRWKTQNNLRFQINRPTWFYKTFSGDYQNMMPHHSDPVGAFEVCVQQTCPLLHNGRIYKCSTSALTPEILQRHNNPNQTEWLPYVDSGLGWDCSDVELQQFLGNFGKPHAMCGQCPSQSHVNSKLNHLQTVTIK